MPQNNEVYGSSCVEHRLKESMKPNWKFQSKDNPSKQNFCMAGTDIFWNNAFHSLHRLKCYNTLYSTIGNCHLTDHNKDFTHTQT